MIYTVPTPPITNQHQVLGYLRDREKNNPQGSEFNHKVLETHGWRTQSPLKVQVRAKTLRMTRRGFTDTDFKLHREETILR